MPLFLIETYSLHKLQYLVETDTAESASSYILEGKAHEFNQEHLDENIFGSWVITMSEAEEIVKNANTTYAQALNNAT
jgi:hypothetical protein